jgi:hypothetical protein
MRCYFMKGGHIAGFEELPGLSDRQAIDRAVDLFTARKRERLDGFEVWNGSALSFRFRLRHDRAGTGTRREL